MIQPSMMSGYGQLHTNEADPKTPYKVLSEYVEITLSDIQAMVDNPPQVDKAQGQWVIPSSHPSRTFKVQQEHGEYWMLWADLDKDPPAMQTVFESVQQLSGFVDVELYSSRSATTDVPKCRILIPLPRPLSFDAWTLSQEILNDRLEQWNITPDRVSQRAAQLCYLPNRGEHYESMSQRDGVLFDPENFWRDEIQKKRKALDDARQEMERLKAQAMAKRASMPTSGLSNTIGLFNQAYSVVEILLDAGYAQRGSHFCHPQSETGSYSASVKDERVYALSPNDLLYTADKSNGAHDAFSAFVVLRHGGDQTQALKDASDNLLTVNGVSLTEHKQREFKRQQEASAISMPFLDSKGQIPGVTQDMQSNPFSLDQFALNGTSKQMRDKMLADKFILGRLAIIGQITHFSAPPNAGKTLLTMWLLRQAIEAGDIEASDVFYINADDNYKGLVEKLSIAEDLGFNMIAPSHKGFELDKFLSYVKKLVADNNVRGKIIILDTLKKFISVMDKDAQSAFNKVLREFVSHGGSAILLGHVNKYLGSDGKHVVAGTTDQTDDADCSYILTPTKHAETGETTVVFENIKSRGDVAETASYCYTRTNGQGYDGLLATVRLATAEEISDARNAAAMEATLEKNHDLIHSILDSMKGGLSLKTEIIKDVVERSGASKPAIVRVLKRHTGNNYVWGHRWTLKIGEHNSHIYRPHPLLMPKVESVGKSYAEASNGG